MMDNKKNFATATAAVETDNLLSHIGWTDSIKPQLDKVMQQYSLLLVSEALGNPLPNGLTREKVAGMCYGINFISDLFKQILIKGDQAIRDLESQGIHLK